MKRQMERADFEKAAEVMHKFASEAFSSGAEITPAMFILRIDEKHHPTACIPFPADFLFQECMGVPGKQMAATVLERLAATPETDMATLLAGAWVVAGLKDEDEIPNSGTEIAEDPRRKEAVACILRTVDFSTMTYFLVNRETRTLLFLPLKWGASGVSGRFAHRPHDQPLN